MSHSALFSLVKARGVEPLSENHLPQLSPSAAVHLTFPPCAAGRQAAHISSHYCMTGAVTLSRSRSPLSHAQNEAAVLIVRTAAFS